MTKPTAKDTLQTAIASATRAIARKKMPVSFNSNHAPDPLSTEPALRLQHVDETMRPDELAALRGEADLAALTRRFHDRPTHRTRRPKDMKSGGIYDALELARIESLGALSMEGSKHNMAARMEAYCLAQGYDRLSERADPPVADIVALLLREKVTGQKPPASTAGLMQLWRKMVDRYAGPIMNELAMHVANQQNFSAKSIELIKTLTFMDKNAQGEKSNEETTNTADESKDDNESKSEQGEPNPMPSPLSLDDSNDSDSEPTPMQVSFGEDMETDEEDPEAVHKVYIPNRRQEDAPQLMLKYRAYTTQFDETVLASKLATPEELTFLRE